MDGDRELLELAAKAAGYEVYAYQREAHEAWGEYPECLMLAGTEWRPLIDDGDALRLAVKLRLDMCWTASNSDVFNVWCEVKSDFLEEKYGNDPLAAARRCIVRAAAEIGKAML